MMTEQELDQIAERAAVYLAFGDPGRLRPGDLNRLLAELRETRADLAHLALADRLHRDQIAALRQELGETRRGWLPIPGRQPPGGIIR